MTELQELRDLVELRRSGHSVRPFLACVDGPSDVRQSYAVERRGVPIAIGTAAVLRRWLETTPEAADPEPPVQAELFS